MRVDANRIPAKRQVFPSGCGGVVECGCACVFVFLKKSQGFASQCKARARDPIIAAPGLPGLELWGGLGINFSNKLVLKRDRFDEDHPALGSVHSESEQQQHPSRPWYKDTFCAL